MFLLYIYENCVTDLLDPAATYFDLERTEAPGPSTQQAQRGFLYT